MTIIVKDTAPPDEEISKTQLWEKIDFTRSLFESSKEDIAGEISSFKDQVISELQAKIMENEENMDKLSKSIDGKLSQFKKEMESLSVKTVASVQSKMDEILGKVEKRIIDLQSSTYSKIDDSTSGFSKDVKENLSNTKREMETVINNSVSSMQAKINDLRRYIDLRLNGLDEATLRKAESEVDKRLKDITTKSIEIKAMMESFQKESSASLSKYQAETMGKISKMNDLFMKIQEKFKTISKMLQ